MAKKPLYPLAEVLQVKRRRVEVAEKILQEKQEILAKEEKILQERKMARDKVKEHQKDKLTQLRQEMDHETSTGKVEQMRAYLKVVKEKLAQEEKKVEQQQQQVDIAQKNVEAARLELQKKRLEVDKLVTHEKDWLKEWRKEEELILGREQDEIGSIIFNIRSRQ